LGAVTVDQHQTIICIVGNEISGDGTTLKKIFESLPSTDIRMVSYGGSAHNISILVPATQKKEVLQQLNSGLFNL
jgi:aspartate kinase